ncbi:hypothetical protein AB0G02_20405 [Actinosynnema sp. NPDC023658]|uniref:hypothetical protein n=1 Tax=Actinosynnema sp. NPDC023658 TaxID=3155465 RepID=UPI0033C88C03
MNATKSRHIRITAAAGAALGLAAAGVVVVPGSAQAAPVAIVCAVGSQRTDYTPPLTNTTRDTAVSSTENYSCTSLLTGVSSATGTTANGGEQSCLLALVPPTDTSIRTYQWNTGQSSTIAFFTNTVATLANGTTVITSVGSVSSGLGQGSAVTRVVAQPSLSLTACATTGINTLNGNATLEILP